MQFCLISICRYVVIINFATQFAKCIYKLSYIIHSRKFCKMLQNKHFQMFYPFTIKDHDLAETYSIETISTMDKTDLLYLKNVGA